MWCNLRYEAFSQQKVFYIKKQNEVINYRPISLVYAQPADYVYNYVGYTNYSNYVT